MGRGCTLTVEIPKCLMRDLLEVSNYEKRPLKSIVKEFLREGLGQYGWSCLADDITEYVKTHNPSEEEKREILYGFAGLVVDATKNNTKKARNVPKKHTVKKRA